jgi:hypothetical protein
MTIKKDILYPIFLECSQFITDKFWDNIFEDLAYGKSPYGTYISKGSLTCKYKDKEFIYKLEKKDPQILYTEIYLLLTKKLGLLSSQDKLNKKIDFENIENEIKEGRKNWNSIRKKNVKDLLIENYVISMKNKYFLNIKQAKYLLSIIFIGMIFKIITIKDIDYKDGIINSINGIEFKKKEIILKKDIYDIKYNVNNIIIEDKNLMRSNWEKYLEYLRKIQENTSLHP